MGNEPYAAQFQPRHDSVLTWCIHFNSEDEGSVFHLNAARQPQDYMTQHNLKPKSVFTTSKTCKNSSVAGSLVCDDVRALLDTVS